MKIRYALLACCLAAPAVAAQHEGRERYGADVKMEHGTQAKTLEESVKKGSEQLQSMELTGDVDRDFVQTMLMHHRHGVEMAQIQLEQGKDKKAKDFARKVIDEQKKDIKELERWLERYPESGQRPTR